ncbi:MAG TPA: hypothetical protein VMW35_18035 [Myxococcota bacterium]|nr:hypothetical protein [Myxococcota bacterium]
MTTVGADPAPSPSAPPCVHRPPCPGCPRYGEPGLAAEARDALSALAADAGLPPPVVEEGAATGFRHRARLMLRGRAAAPKLGLFEAGTHRVVDVPRCRVHHEAVNEVAAHVRRLVRALRLAPYSDRRHAGLVRALQVVVERPTQRVQVVLVTNEAAPGAATSRLLEALAEALGPKLQGLHWNGNPERTNVILGPAWRRIRGEEAVRERIGGADVFFPPGAFGQSHLDLADRLVAHVHGLVPESARVAELYAGCGAIGLGLAAQRHAVVFNERGEAALRGLALGLSALSADARASAAVRPGPAAEEVALLRDCDVAIVDPPRKGLDAALLAALCEAPPPRLVVVSCGLGAFLREASALRAAGLRLASLRAFALLPYTEHVETVACFERERAPSSARNASPAPFHSSGRSK